ncbi:MAG: virulence RhuM family protein [Burkholderiaceae bacterium]|nr:virulence RhuM family protein [Burkholderiaceae bacterium]
MAELFERDKSVIARHLKNIFDANELERAAVVAKNATTAADGKTYQVEYFNLDVIISVGYRVNSTRATRFRQWATRMLRQHLVEGYTLNQQRLRERGIEFEQALNLDEALVAIAQLKAELIAKGEATELFGQLRGDGLASAIATIEQDFGDELFYPNVASRAAHLLYFVIKNRPLADGNKRTGSFLFLWYLRLNQHLLARSVEQLVNDNTLVALALLVARASRSKRN